MSNTFSFASSLFSQNVCYDKGAESGYIHFEEPDAIIKARAAAEFVKGVTVKKSFVYFEAVTGKQILLI